jgi:hypothetical protein
MTGVIASIIDGVLVGAVYGLAAMGLTLIWGVMNVINLTHGAMIVLGMFALYFLTSALGLPPYGAVPVTIILGFFFGVAVYWIAVHRVIGRAHLMSLLDLRNEYGPDRPRYGAIQYEPLQRSGRHAWGDVERIYLHRHAYHGGHPGLADRRLALSFALPDSDREGDSGGFRQSRSGRAQRHPTTQVLSFAFGLGVALASVSGTLIATLFPFTVLSGGAYELKSFVVTVLGGLGNPAVRSWAVLHSADRGHRDPVHAGKLDSDYRIRAVHRRVDLVPRGIFAFTVLSR